MTARILFLTPDLPHPPHQGAAIRSFNLIKNLATRYDIHLLSFVREGDAPGNAGPLAEYCTSIVTVPAPGRSTTNRALSVLLSAEPDMALRLPSPQFTNPLRICLKDERFDFVQVEAIEMAQYGVAVKEMSVGSPPKVIFDDINAEYLLQRRAFETDIRHPGRWLGALYSLIQWQKLRRYEAKVCRRVDRVVVVSPADQKALQQLAPDVKSIIVPNGVDISYYSPAGTEKESDTTLVFTGKMDFRPNVDAVLWFTQKVWPLIQKEVPEAHFNVVGRDPHPRLQSLKGLRGISVTGHVEDIRPFVADAGVYVVPLRVGGGTRLKVLEAMSMGKAIVCTSLGREGIDITPGQEVVIADEPLSFAHRILDLMRDRARRRELGLAARRLAELRYDWRHITSLMEMAYES